MGSGSLSMFFFFISSFSSFPFGFFRIKPAASDGPQGRGASSRLSLLPPASRPRDVAGGSDVLVPALLGGVGAGEGSGLVPVPVSVSVSVSVSL